MQYDNDNKTFLTTVYNYDYRAMSKNNYGHNYSIPSTNKLVATTAVLRSDYLYRISGITYYKTITVISLPL